MKSLRTIRKHWIKMIPQGLFSSHDMTIMVGGEEALRDYDEALRANLGRTGGVPPFLGDSDV